MATVFVLQFLRGLSDRQAAEAVRLRIDVMYAMALGLDDQGFHRSVPADFRERLAEGDRADRLLDLALTRLKEAGLVGERSTQRSDSTHVLAAVRDLTRLELVTEAVRAALEDVARTAEYPLVGLGDEDWGRRYARPVRLGKNPTRPRTRINTTGGDAVRLLEHLREHGIGHAFGPGARRCGRSWCQNCNCQVSAGRHGPYPTSPPTAAPLIVARFTAGQCQPCPDRPRCTSARESARSVGRVEGPLRGPLRSGGHCQRVRHGHGMRRCRYRVQPKAHPQHVLTAIAVNIERLSGRPAIEQASSPRPPTALQTSLGQQGILRSNSVWRGDLTNGQ